MALGTKEMVCVSKTMAFVIGTLAFEKNIMVPTSETSVAAAKKMASVALTIGFASLEWRFRSWLFFGAREKGNYFVPFVFLDSI
jgi:hypothetical protein